MEKVFFHRREQKERHIASRAHPSRPYRRCVVKKKVKNVRQILEHWQTIPHVRATFRRPLGIDPEPMTMTLAGYYFFAVFYFVCARETCCFFLPSRKRTSVADKETMDFLSAMRTILTRKETSYQNIFSDISEWRTNKKYKRIILISDLIKRNKYTDLY